MAGKILVMGATGAVGSELVRVLLARGEPVRAATRCPRSERAASDPEYVELDLDRPGTFAPALAGVDRVFLMARPGDDQAHQTAIPLIDACRRFGVSRLIALTALGIERLEDNALRRVERHLEGSGIGFTHLRPNWFMQNFVREPLLSGLRATRSIALPAADAAISFIDVRDIAQVAAAALCEPGHGGKAYALTGGEALDHGEIARIIGQCVNATVRYLALDEEAARRALGATGLPAQRVERLLGMYRLVRQGFSAGVSPDVQAVLGRPPTTFAEFARQHAACWS